MKAYLACFVLYFHCYVLKADLTSYYSRSSLYLMDKPDNSTNCTKILHDFADSASSFAKCSIRHASPVNLCMKCIDHYVNFTNKYELLTQDVNGYSCKSLFISHDRLDVVLAYHDNILSVWENGHCNACFNWTLEKPEPLNDTLVFKEMYNTTMLCIEPYLNKTMSNRTEEACQKCYPMYVKLDEFYKSLSTDSIGVDCVCMDIVDAMNATRSIWSKVLHCCDFRRSPEITFLCCTAIIATLPLMFYIAVRFCGPIRDLPNVLKQSRFKQMILRSSNDGRIN